MQAELTLRIGDHAGRRYVIQPGQRLCLGRSSENDVHLRDGRASRCHAVLEMTEEGVFVTDLGSRNGTLIHGELITPHTPTPMAAGKILKVGSQQFTLSIEGALPVERNREEHAAGLGALLSEWGDYELLEKLGSGGAKGLWMGQDARSGRYVAVKEFRSEGTVEGQDYREHLLRELELWKRVDSPYVVEVHAVCPGPESVVVVMELVEGPSARERQWDTTQVPTPDVLKIGEGASRALAGVAEVGLVHTNLKPGNVILDPSGLAKLTDFGPGRLSDGVRSINGIPLGSLPYVAPEQLDPGAVVDARASVYGIGATLYYLLAGRPALVTGIRRRANPLELAQAIREEEPEPLCERSATCPPGVAELVQQMLAKDPAARPELTELIARLCELRITLFPDYRVASWTSMRAMTKTWA